MANLIVYVDESGNAVLNKPEHIKKFPFFVIGFVVCQEPQLLRKKIRHLMIRLHKRKKYRQSVRFSCKNGTSSRYRLSIQFTVQHH